MNHSGEFGSLSDEQLASECAKRPPNEEAWKVFWRRFYPLVYRTVLRSLDPFYDQAIHSGVDDIVQLVFLRIFQSLPKFDRKKSPLSAYLRMMAKHTVIDQLRRSKGKETASLEGFEELKASVKADAIPVEVLWETVLAHVSNLEPRKREIIRAYFRGEKTDAICDRYGIKSNHLSTIIYRFKQDLKSSLFKK